MASKSAGGTTPPLDPVPTERDPHLELPAFGPLPKDGELPPEVAERLQSIGIAMEFPGAPNFFRAMAITPSVLEAVWSAVSALMLDPKGVIEPQMRQAIIFAISASRGCEYCEAAHLALCRRTGLNEAEIEDYQGANRDILRFAVKAAVTPQELDERDIHLLRRHSFTEAQILEVIGLASLTVMLNTVADALRVPIDEPMKTLLQEPREL